MAENKKVQKGDFVKLEFTGKVADTGEIFDTTRKKDAKEMGLKKEVEPITVVIGKEMTIKGLDNELEGKEIGEEYKAELKPKQAFGNRDPKLIRTYSLASFLERDINPQPGMMLALDNSLAKVISVSGGRVMIDMNNPLAGKNIEYDFKILEKIDKQDEKIKSLSTYFFNKELDFEVKDKKIKFKAPKMFEQMILAAKPKFKEILELDLEFEVKEEKTENKKSEEKADDLENKVDKKQEKKEENKVDKKQEKKEEKEEIKKA